MGNIAIHGNRGIHMKFDNGLTISIQIGTGSYCSNKNQEAGSLQIVNSCNNAEIAIWDKMGNWHVFNDGDTVQGFVDVDKIGKIINKVRKAKSLEDLKV